MKMNEERLDEVCNEIRAFCKELDVSHIFTILAFCNRCAYTNQFLFEKGLVDEFHQFMLGGEVAYTTIFTAKLMEKVHLNVLSKEEVNEI